MATVLTELKREAVSLDEGAQILGIHKETLRRAIKAGRLRAFKTSHNGHFRIWIADLKGFLCANIQEEIIENKVNVM